MTMHLRGNKSQILSEIYKSLCVSGLVGPFRPRLVLLCPSPSAPDTPCSAGLFATSKLPDPVSLQGSGLAAPSSQDAVPAGVGLFHSLTSFTLLPKYHFIGKIVS